MVLRRDQTCRVGNVDITLPPGHDLPNRRGAHPWYGRYFLPILVALARQSGRLTLVDVGANVGDVAAAALSVIDDLQVVAVEGDRAIVPYLQRNLETFGERACLVEGFVFDPHHDHLRTAGPHLTVPSLVEMAQAHGHPAGACGAGTCGAGVDGAGACGVGGSAMDLLWRTATGTVDVELLTGAWPVIDPRCAAIWFEYDPWRSLSSIATTARLMRLLAQSGREVVIFDHLGNHMLQVSGPDVVRVLTDLTRWLERQHDSAPEAPPVPHVEIWAFDRGRWSQLVQDAIRGAVAVP